MTAVKLGSSVLAAGASADYELSEGKLTLHPATGVAALKTPGAWNITVEATGYSNSSVAQSVLNGAPASLTVSTQPVPGNVNGGIFTVQPVVTLKDRYGNTVAAGAGSTANVEASVKALDSWVLGGTRSRPAVAGVAAFGDLTYSGRQSGAKMTFASDGKTVDSEAFDIIIPVGDLSATAGNGQAAFTFTAPAGASTVRVHKSSLSAVAGFADTGLALDSASTSVLVNGLTNETQYWFKLVVTGGLFAGDSNVVTATPGVVAASVIAASTAGGDAKVNIAEKAAGFNVVARSTAAGGFLYLVPEGVYADEAALNAAKIASAPVAGANVNITISVGPGTDLADAAAYKVYAVDGTHYLSSAADAFVTDLTCPEFALTYPRTAGVGTTSFDLKLKAVKNGVVYYVVLADGSAVPGAAQVKAGTHADGSPLAANLKGSAAVAAGVETSVGVSGLADGHAYDVYAVIEDGAANLSTALKAEAGTAMILIADAAGNNVDNDIEITFSENASWRNEITAVKSGGTPLNAASDYLLTAGVLTLRPSGGNALLRTPGVWSITVEASGYAASAVDQTVAPGAVSSLTVTTQPAAGGRMARSSRSSRWSR